MLYYQQASAGYEMPYLLEYDGVGVGGVGGVGVFDGLENYECQL
jgi:hypothetical protein